MAGRVSGIAKHPGSILLKLFLKKSNGGSKDFLITKYRMSNSSAWHRQTAEINTKQKKLETTIMNIEKERKACENNNDVEATPGYKYYQKEVNSDIPKRQERDIKELNDKKSAYNSRRQMMIDKLQAEMEAHDAIIDDKIQMIKTDNKTLTETYIAKMQEMKTKNAIPTTMTYRKNIEQKDILEAEIEQLRAERDIREQEECDRKMKERRERAQAEQRALERQEEMQRQRDKEEYLRKKAIADKEEEERLTRNEKLRTRTTSTTLKPFHEDMVIVMLSKEEMAAIDRKTIPDYLKDSWDEHWDELNALW